MRDGEVDRNTSSKKKAEEVAEEQETRAKAQDRESREQTPTQSEKSLTQKERNTVSEHGNLSPLTVYSIILLGFLFLGVQDQQNPLGKLNPQ